MSVKSPDVKKLWPSRFLNLNAASALRSERTYETISDACCHLTYQGLSTSPSFNRCPCKWPYPVSNSFIILKLVSAQFVNYTASLAEGLLRRTLACVCPHRNYEYSSCFLLIQPLITLLATFADMPRADSNPTNGSEKPCLANWSPVNMNVTMTIFKFITLHSCLHKEWSYRNQVVSILGNLGENNKGCSSSQAFMTAFLKWNNPSAGSDIL